MKLSSIAMARVISFVSIEEINPQGRIFYPDLSKALVQQFEFQKVPRELWELTLQTGAEFEHGKIGEIVVQKFTIYRNGFALDTASSTNDSEIALESILAWGVEKFKIAYKPEMVRTKLYYSQVVVSLDIPLDSLNPALVSLGRVLSATVSKQARQRLNFETSRIDLSIDPTSSKLVPGLFSLEKRAEVPYSENKYFSGAPLRTEEHLKLLEEFEADLLGQSERSSGAPPSPPQKAQ